MRIERVEVKPLAVPLARGYHWRFGVDEFAPLVLVLLHGEGLVGVGEAVASDAEASALLARRLAPFYAGRSPHEFAAIRNDVWTSGRWSVTPRLSNQLLSAFECACLDLAGKAVGLPAADLLGGRLRAQVEFFGFVQGETAAECGEHARALAAEGYEVLYVKASGAADDVERVRLVREAAGPDVLVRVDPNEAWDVPTAIERIRAMEAYGVDWIEQPVAGENVAGLRDVRASVRTKIAADNSVYTPVDARRVLDAGAADAVVLSFHEAGGPWRWYAMGLLADTYGIPIGRKGHLESSVSSFAALQAMAAVPNLARGNQLTHQLLASSLTTTPFEVRNGWVDVPDAPGHGFELDLDVVADAEDRHRAAVARPV